MREHTIANAIRPEYLITDNPKKKIDVRSFEYQLLSNITTTTETKNPSTVNTPASFPPCS
jgi:hypothetical protein